MTSNMAKAYKLRLAGMYTHTARYNAMQRMLACTAFIGVGLQFCHSLLVHKYCAILITFCTLLHTKVHTSLGKVVFKSYLFNIRLILVCYSNLRN